jgi:hypothetical protein
MGRLWGTPIFILSVSDGTATRVLFTAESYATLGTALWGPSLPSRTAPIGRLWGAYGYPSLPSRTTFSLL